MQDSRQQIDKRIRRSAIKLALVGMAIGLLIGLAMGYTVGWITIERTVIVPVQQGIKT